MLLRINVTEHPAHRRQGRFAFPESPPAGIEHQVRADYEAIGRTWGVTRCSVSTPAPSSVGSLRATAARQEDDGSVIARPVSPQRAPRAVPAHSALRHVVVDRDQGDRARECKFPTPSTSRRTTSSLQIGPSSGARRMQKSQSSCWPMRPPMAVRLRQSVGHDVQHRGVGDQAEMTCH
jgi:hypothetical protein